MEDIPTITKQKNPARVAAGKKNIKLRKPRTQPRVFRYAIGITTILLVIGVGGR